MRKKGVEPIHPKWEQEPESCASTNFATFALHDDTQSPKCSIRGLSRLDKFFFSHFADSHSTPVSTCQSPHMLSTWRVAMSRYRSPYAPRHGYGRPPKTPRLALVFGFGHTPCPFDFGSGCRRPAARRQTFQQSPAPPNVPIFKTKK